MIYRNVLVIGLSLLYGILFYNANDISKINKDIKSTQTRQKDIDKQAELANQKLSTLGQNIAKAKQEIKKLDSQIQNLTRSIQNNKDQNKSQEAKLQSLKNRLSKLSKDMNSSQEELAQIILRYMTYSRVLDNEEVWSLDDMMTKHAFDILKKDTVKKLDTLQRQQLLTVKQISDINNSIKEVTKIITNEENKYQDLQNMITRQKGQVEQMQSQVKVYNKRLTDLASQKNELGKILVNLNIQKKNTQEEQRKRAEAEKKAKAERERQARLELERKKKEEEQRRKAQIEKAEAEKKVKAEAERIAQKDSKQAQKFLEVQSKVIESDYQAKISTQEANAAIDNFELSRVDSIYQPVSTIKYTGKKMLSPLKSYILEQSFGDYLDPVYKIKIFNNGVVLKPNGEDSQVYNIMDGKILHVQEVPGLKKVVIVEHANSLHTIYSMLDNTAPTLKKGFVVKQGYVIGRVSDRLNLEIIQGDKHINPMEAISNRK
ncbi:hypothetical protein LS73_002935 [Helicobacter muridarum]|uniref:Metallopeptidase n=1 Tax=Helicobacter muridarum TaxID=216 RepID=A0A099TZ38_9HELI|nr:peptidoglycan DD-metalloendopeptidase family protein [Helicobacter muridarum]TLE00872.1 hypothetical protein LS73_002935 [Helicobacter muridarum]STQ86644.1 metallopeptidase [Helicobacter muridarum]